MKCPKCRADNPPGAKECAECAVVFRHIRGGKREDAQIDRQCNWNDHGYRCDRAGCVSEATSGAGPWYCSEHYWFGLRKMVKRATSNAAHVSYREQWYRDRGRDYQPPPRLLDRKMIPRGQR